MASTDFRVLTPERVSLQYDIAGIGSRGAALIVDSLIQTAIALVAAIAVSGGALTLISFVGDAAGLLAGVLLYALIALALFAITFGYFMVFEIMWSGQTPGKRVVGLRVIRENGYPIRPVDAVIRNLVRIVDALPFGYAVGVLAMLFNSRSRRLGDFAAGTLVVREGARSRHVFAEALEPEQPAAMGVNLRAEDATLVRDFLVRRSGMSPPARADLARRLANAMSARYGVTVEADPEVFLERLGA
jgi:uncharacterized RDD family membrane protein YckC